MVIYQCVVINQYVMVKSLGTQIQPVFKWFDKINDLDSGLEYLPDSLKMIFILQSKFHSKYGLQGYYEGSVGDLVQWRTDNSELVKAARKEIEETFNLETCQQDILQSQLQIKEDNTN